MPRRSFRCAVAWPRPTSAEPPATVTALLTAICLVLPVGAPVLDPYREPACERCAGNRGIEFATRPGVTVTAGAGGVVTFVGPVGGRLYVVLRAAADSRVRVTYGGLAGVSVGTGDTVARGDPLGSAGDVLFVGTRVGERHVDPLTMAARPERSDRTGPSPTALLRPRFPVTLVAPGAGVCGTARFDPPSR